MWENHGNHGVKFHKNTETNKMYAHIDPSMFFDV